MGVGPFPGDAATIGSGPTPPGLTSAARRTIGLGAFLAVFLGSLLLLADGVGILVKLAVGLPLVVMGVAGGLAAVRPRDGWTTAPDRRPARSTAPRAGRAAAFAGRTPPADSTSIRQTAGPAARAAGTRPTSRQAWYFLPLLPGCLLAGLLLASDGDLLGPIKAALVVSTGVLATVVVLALVRVRRRAAGPVALPPIVFTPRRPVR